MGRSEPASAMTFSRGIATSLAALREVSGIALEAHLDAWAQDAAHGRATPADLKEIAGLLRRRLR